MLKLNGDIPVELRRQTALPLRDTDRSTLSFQLEFLDSCDWQCPGCFVKRRNSYTDEDLDCLVDLAVQFNDKGFEMNEIVLAPTDIFACRNSDEILQNKKFQKLFNYFHALTFASTLQSDYDHVKKLVDLMSELPSSIYLEMFVIFDMEKYNKDNILYIELLERNLELLKEANIIFAFNIHDEAFDNFGYNEMSRKVNERYNSHLKMVPSFFRAPKTSTIVRNLEMWKDKLRHNIIEQESESILNNMSDTNFGGYTYFIYVYRNGTLYMAPFIYDFIFEDNPKLVIPREPSGMYSFDTVSKYEMDNIIQQYWYSETAECKDCKYLPSCVGKKVLSFMENRNIQHCILPKDVMDYQNNI